jgi:hypothetical protein
MTGGYAQASQFLDDLKDLSLTSANPGTAIRKLSTALRQNNGYRQVLVDALNQYSGVDLKGHLAGLSLSNLAPRGISGPLTGAGLLSTIAAGIVTPKAALAAAIASPRLMGELMVAMGKARPAISGIAPGAGAAAAMVGNSTRQNGTAANWQPLTNPYRQDFSTPSSAELVKMPPTYTEAEVRTAAAWRGKDPDIAVALARQRGLIQ